LPSCHHIRGRTALASLALVLGAAVPCIAQAPRTHRPAPTTAAISVRDLETRVYVIADDSMEGREAGRPGALKAAAYIAREAKRLGLEPGGTNGSYFQDIPLVRRSPDSTSSLRVEAPGDSATTLVYGRDFAPYPRTAVQTFLGGNAFGGTFAGERVPVVFGGRIGDSTLIDPALAEGKFVVFTAPADLPGLGRFFQAGVPARYRRAAAIGLVRPDGLPPFLRAPRDFYGDAEKPWPMALPVVALTADAARGLLGAGSAPGPTGRAVSGRFGYLDTPTPVPSRNVVAILRGADPRLRTQLVAIGSHYDHVGLTPRPLDHDSIRAYNAVVRPRGADDPPREPSADEVQRVREALARIRAERPARADSINNGADDDASGAAIMLEIAEAFSAPRARPARSLLFVWHTAEEKGLYGAQYFSDHPSVPLDSIVAMVNMDQMGRGDPEDAPTGGPNSLVVIGSRRLSTELGDLVERVNARPAHGFRLDYGFDRDGDPTNAYCRSDHYMYARYGVPVVFFSAAAWHRDYHMVSDEPQYIAYERMAKIGAYVRDVVGELAGAARRPVVDRAKPDPDGVCVQ
jgi:hypothetical protein